MEMEARGNGQSPTQFTALAPHYDELMNVVPYDVWADYVFLLFQVAEHDAQRVLDCACGTGNVSFELAKSVSEVVGVDIAPAMIDIARRKVGGVKNIRFIEADLANFDLGETFDCATCLYDSLNYILDPAKLQSAFEHIGHHIEAGGVFVFDMNTPFALTQDLFTQYSRDPRKKLHYDWHARFDSRSKITSVEMEFTLYNANGTKSKFFETHQERAYELDEVRAMLEETGWQLERVYDAYTLNLPHDQSERWFFLARRSQRQSGI